VKRRTWRLTGLIVILVLVASAVTLIVRNRHTAPAAAACPWPVVPSAEALSVPTDDTRRSISAPAGGNVSVTETGFTQTDKGQQVSIGAIVRNTSTRVAYHTRVLFHAYTKSGASAIAAADRYRYLMEIPILRPGQQAAIGDQLGLNPALANDFLEFPAVTTVVVEVLQTLWIPAADTASFPRITAGLDPAHVPVDGGGVITVTALTTSDACRDLGGRGVGAVFRNSAGAIIGGTLDISRQEQIGICATGDNTASAGAYNSPAKVDLSRTEVSVLCDVTASTYATPGPDQPVN
jgi:hypothetical protein